jgi:hypothetical protein
MLLCSISDLLVTATACEVMPHFGLVYLIDDQDRSWAITNSTKGPGLACVALGQRCQLTLNDHGSFAAVREYALMT